MANKDDDLPPDYDTIVLGTGLSESILAAACSRIGQKVLHLDRHSYYGSQWATHTFTSLTQWILEQKDGLQIPPTCPDTVQSLLNEGETLKPVLQNVSSFRNVEERWYIEEGCDEPPAEPKPPEPEREPEPEPETKPEPHSEPNSELSTESQNEGQQQHSNQPDDQEKSETSQNETGNGQNETETSHNETKTHHQVTTAEEIPITSSQPKTVKKPWTQREIRKQSRRFNLDLCPKLLYCRGDLVNLLISSDIAKYCEFKLVTRILTMRDGKLEPVPCSRSDVFASQAINMIEKRMLMKFLEFALNYQNHMDELTEYAEKPFIDYLESRKLTPIVIHYILNAIAMIEANVPTMEGLSATNRYLMSLGRYGNSSFLWPLYGASELPQAFCRMCAVFGGTYCLNKTPSHLIVDSENKCVGMVCDEKRLNCRWAVLEASYASTEVLPQDDEWSVSRAILLTDRALVPDKDEEVTMMFLPRSGLPSARLLQLPPSTYAAPRGIYVVHLSCPGILTPEEGLRSLVDFLFSSDQQDDSKPRLLYSLFFTQSESSSRSKLRPLVDNVEILAGPDETLHYALAVEQAKAKFEKICPDEEFLPKAPNPEDIIIEGLEETPQTIGGGFGAEAPEGASTEPEVDQTKPEVSEREPEVAASSSENAAKSDDVMRSDTSAETNDATS